MSLTKKVNGVRRTIMRGLTRRLGESSVDGGAMLRDPSAVQRILVCRPNHRLGNLLLITPLLSEIAQTFPGARIDLFAKGHLPPVLFKNCRNIGRIIQLPKKPFAGVFKYLRGWMAIMSSRYDVVVNVIFNSSSGRISARVAHARLKFTGEPDDEIRARFPDHEHMAKFPVYAFRQWIGRLGVKASDLPVPVLDLGLTPDEIAAGEQLLADLVQNRRRTIALYTYATGSKCYEREWWTDVYSKLKERFAEFNIIEILPVENVSQIGFAAPSFYSRDIRQIASLMKNVDVFIGADSGMMHLASAAQVPVLGLFKAENMNTYAPYGNGSHGVNTNLVSADRLVEDVADMLQESLLRVRAL